MIRKITGELRAHIVTPRSDSALLEKILSAAYDVCIVGSGPGGSVTACALAEAGMNVLLVERGPFLPAEAFNFRVLDMSNRLGYLELTSGFRAALYQGNVLGGGSILYGGVAFFSSSLLLRNGGRFPGRARIGAKVFLQPHAQIFALFDRPITRQGEVHEGQYIPYNGVPAIYNFTGFLKEHRFFWLASILFPANLASFISNLPPGEHYEIMRRFHNTMSITVTLRDDPSRSRIVLKNGRPQLDFLESASDIENLRRCFLLAARGFLAVGARRVFLPMLDPPGIEKEADLGKIEKMSFGYDDLLLYSDHTSGGNSYGVDPEHGVTDPDGRVFGTENVYVADSSLFPSACGINPSWTIMALARRVAVSLS